MCLEANPSSDNGAVPSFQNCNESINQRWRFIPDIGSGASTIVPELFKSEVSGSYEKCLDENSQGGSVYQWNCDGTSDQYFNLLPLSTTAPSSTPRETSIPSANPTIAPSLIPTAAPSVDLCDIMDVVGQTIYVAGAGACWRVQLARGGTLEGDTTDASCAKNESEWKSTTGVFSRFYSAVSDDNTAVFKADNAWKGTFQFKEDPTLTKPSLTPLSIDQANNTFELQVTVPTCSADAICPTMKVNLF
jgi:hypothetical protein